ncbi:hypothetical protein ABZT02_40460 [Streptomyces sp. NPDC005402]|uniref:hypothetical protein n=1 Tax=Streptomyces sp. NPDC005402 TaxID=3155338 RepID=UPI0033AEE4B6
MGHTRTARQCLPSHYNGSSAPARRTDDALPHAVLSGAGAAATGLGLEFAALSAYR